MASEKKSFPADNDWERRVLCSDESCIGVIGPDGRCKECGLVYEGALSRQTRDGEGGEPTREEAGVAVSEEAEVADDLAEKEEDVADDFAEKEEDSAEIPDDDWNQRVLCSDESCIGVIGPDGRCKECGTPFRKD